MSSRLLVATIRKFLGDNKGSKMGRRDTLSTPFSFRKAKTYLLLKLADVYHECWLRLGLKVSFGTYQLSRSCGECDYQGSAKLQFLGCATPHPLRLFPRLAKRTIGVGQ